MNSIVDDNGVVRYLGNNPAPQGLVKAWPVFGSTPSTPIIPRSQWKSRIGDNRGPEDPFINYVHDQNGYGMCNCSATASAMERCRARQGLEFIALSAGDLYRRISGGGDNGSLLEDGLRVSMEQGIADTTVVPYLDWRGANPGEQENRKNYKVLEAFLCEDFEQCMSAVLADIPFDLISGGMWYANYTPDSEGWLPTRKSGGNGGHAVHGYKATYRGDAYGIWHKNSWTKNWGLNGLCVFPETFYQNNQISGIWAVRAVTDSGGVVPPLAA